MGLSSQNPIPSGQEKGVEEVFARESAQSDDDDGNVGEGKLAGKTCEEGGGEHEAMNVDLPSDPDSEDEVDLVGAVGEQVKSADEICTGGGVRMWLGQVGILLIRLEESMVMDKGMRVRES